MPEPTNKLHASLTCGGDWVSHNRWIGQPRFVVSKDDRIVHRNGRENHEILRLR